MTARFKATVRDHVHGSIAVGDSRVGIFFAVGGLRIMTTYYSEGGNRSEWALEEGEE